MNNAAMIDPQIRRTIRREELRQIVPLSDSTIYDMEAKGKFPRRFALTPRCVVWYLDEVLQWVEARRTGQVAVQPVAPPKPKRKQALKAMPV